jgi:hypothetical protein
LRELFRERLRCSNPHIVIGRSGEAALAHAYITGVDAAHRRTAHGRAADQDVLDVASLEVPEHTRREQGIPPVRAGRMGEICARIVGIVDVDRQTADRVFIGRLGRVEPGHDQPVGGLGQLLREEARLLCGKLGVGHTFTRPECAGPVFDRAQAMRIRIQDRDRDLTTMMVRVHQVGAEQRLEVHLVAAGTGEDLLRERITLGHGLAEDLILELRLVFAGHRDDRLLLGSVVEVVTCMDRPDFVFDRLAGPQGCLGRLHVGQAEGESARLIGHVAADVGEPLGNVDILIGMALGYLLEEIFDTLLVKDSSPIPHVRR